MKTVTNPYLSHASAAAALVLLAASAHAASVSYQFTGGSLAPIVTGLPAGVTASDFSLGSFTFANLSDNGGSGNSLRISGNDFTAISTGASITANTVLSFSLTIPVGVTLDLTSLTYDFTSNINSALAFMNARVFSEIPPVSVVADTIGVIGVSIEGATSGTGVSLSLATPDSNPGNGANSNNGDFNSLTNQTITFFMPIVKGSEGIAATDYTDFDNFTLNFVPEPSSALLGALGMLVLLRRRRA